MKLTRAQHRRVAEILRRKAADPRSDWDFNKRKLAQGSAKNHELLAMLQDKLPRLRPHFHQYPPGTVPNGDSGSDAK